MPPGSMIQAGEVSRQLSDPKKHMASLLERLFSDLKPNTLRAYQKAWDVLAEFLGLPDRIAAAHHLTAMTGPEANLMAMEWLAAMKADDYAPATVATRFAALKGVLKRMRIIGLVTWNVEVKGPQVNTLKDTTGPGKEAIVKMIQDLRERTDPKGLRDMAIISVLYTTALRRGELAAVEISDIEIEKDQVWITGKGRDDREKVTLTPVAKASIEKWLAARPGTSNHLFVSLDPAHYGNPLSDQGIWRITISYGLGNPHGLRHSAITEILEKTGGNIRTAQEFSRHRDVRMLQRYDDNRKNLAGEASNMLDKDL